MESISHEKHFWLRHARRAQEPVIIMGPGGLDIVDLLYGQGISAQTALPFTPPQRTGMVGLMLGTFATLGTLAERRETLQAIHGMLPVGGKLIIALWMPTLAALTAPEGVARLMRGDKQDTLRWRVSRTNLLAQSLEHTDVVEELDAGGQVKRRTYHNSTDYYVWPNEMRLLFLSTGYEVEAVFGGWNDEPLTEDAPLQVWVARKGM